MHSGISTPIWEISCFIRSILAFYPEKRHYPVYFCTFLSWGGVNKNRGILLRESSCFRGGTRRLGERNRRSGSKSPGSWIMFIEKVKLEKQSGRPIGRGDCFVSRGEKYWSLAGREGRRNENKREGEWKDTRKGKNGEERKVATWLFDKCARRVKGSLPQ